MTLEVWYLLGCTPLQLDPRFLSALSFGNPAFEKEHLYTITPEATFGPLWGQLDSPPSPPSPGLPGSAGCRAGHSAPRPLGERRPGAAGSAGVKPGIEAMGRPPAEKKSGTVEGCEIQVAPKKPWLKPCLGNTMVETMVGWYLRWGIKSEARVSEKVVQECRPCTICLGQSLVASYVCVCAFSPVLTS